MPQTWFAEMPRPLLQLPQKRAAAALGTDSSGVGRAAGTIDQYYLSRHCAVREIDCRVLILLCEFMFADEFVDAFRGPLGVVPWSGSYV